jgi:DNA-binding beta-propeller fold protein YncE
MSGRDIVALLLVVMLLAADAPGIAYIRVPGNPFMALPSADGSRVFVSVDGAGRQGSELEILRRDGFTLTPRRTIRLGGSPAGLALTPDGKALLVADWTAYGIMPIAPSREADATDVALLGAGGGAGIIEAIASPDGRYAFFSNERRGTVDVVKIVEDGEQSHLVFVASIRVDLAPVGLALSPDGSYLYVTSEASRGVTRECGSLPPGTLSAIDVRRAESDPAHAVVASVSVGCEPVRVAASPSGDVLWVTVRGANRLAAFDARKLLSGDRNPLIVSMLVGESPVGLLIAGNGRYVLVANSARFDPSRPNGTVTIVDGSDFLSGGKVVTRTIPAGEFPRELTEAPQKDAVYLTNYSSGTVEMIPETLLPKDALT